MKRMVFVGLFWLCIMWLPLEISMGEDPARVTPAVKVIDKIQAAIVPVFCSNPEGQIAAGSATVIHPDGFMLTADHVTQEMPGVVLLGLERFEYDVVGRLPERDIAILKLRDPKKVSSVIRFGSSHDLKLGEPIIVGGNPGGRGIVFSQGTINSRTIEPSWPNILVRSYWRNETTELSIDRRRTTGGRPDFIQFDATTNRGNSGGPVVNFEASLIGLVSQKSFSEEGINWGVPIDRIRALIPHLVPSEEIGDFWTGVQIDVLAPDGVIDTVLENSPASKAGLRKGDIVRTVNGRPVLGGYEWYFALWQHKPDDKLNISFSRDGGTQNVELILEKTATCATSRKAEDVTAGIHYDFYSGMYPSMPTFSTMKSERSGKLAKFDLDAVIKKSPDQKYAIVFSGFIQFDQAGLYRFHLSSDDGSKLYLCDRLLIDNDLGHPLQTLSRWARVPAGLVPYRLEYTNLGGDRGLDLSISRDLSGKDKITPKFILPGE